MVPALVKLPKNDLQVKFGYHYIQLDPQMQKRVFAFVHDHLGEVQTTRNPRSGT